MGGGLISDGALSALLLAHSYSPASPVVSRIGFHGLRRWEASPFKAAMAVSTLENSIRACSADSRQMTESIMNRIYGALGRYELTVRQMQAVPALLD